jgi:hypothetical protein
MDRQQVSDMEIFVPFSEAVVAEAGIVGRLVPFQLEYPCARLHGWEAVELLTGESVGSESPGADQLQRH